jgi:hypothetical protein
VGDEKIRKSECISDVSCESVGSDVAVGKI